MESPYKTYKGLGGIRRIAGATRNSLHGLAAAFHDEAAFRLELLAAAVFVPLGLWLGANGIERALLVGAVLLVLILELLNSAVENTVDRISLDRHPLAKRAKDVASAAVMLSLVNAAVVWLLVLIG
jgi:diacylglycerol kinase (ATP)